MSPMEPRAWSHVIDVAGVPEKGLVLALEPPSAALPAIAAECGIPAVAGLRVRTKILPRAGGRFEVSGTVTARVTQVCVVTLEPFASDISDDVEVTFAPASAAAGDWLGSDARRERRDTRNARGANTRSGPERGRSAREATVPVASTPMNDDTPDLPDPIIDGRIDLGALALEFLVLALDPYPKKPGVAFDGAVIGEDEAEPSAFAALARLKDSP